MARSSVPAWQRKLHIRKSILTNSIKTENFTYLHIQAVLAHTHDTTEPPANAVDDFTELEIKNLNIALAEENEAAFAVYKIETEGLEGERDALEWKRRMVSDKEQAKKNLCHAVSNTYHAAEGVISNLPPHKQEAAFDLFEVGQNFVSQAFDWCVTEMARVARKDPIAELMRGRWAPLHAAWDAVKEGVSTVIDWIKGIFGAPPPPGGHGHAKEEPPAAAPGSAPEALLDVRVELIWKSWPMLPEASVKEAALYLHGQFDHALCRHVEMGPAFQQGREWHATVTVSGVAVADISDVISALREVVGAEDARRECLPSHPDVPTPDPVSAHNPSAVSRGAVEVQIRKSELPLRLAPMTPIKVNGRHLTPVSSAGLPSPSRVYTVVD